MQAIVNLDDVPVVERQHARAGLFRAQALLAGEEGSRENFFIQLSHTYSDFASPRHRHNFDQVRIQLRGDADFARDGVMKEGSIGYFPEGVFYGPQSIAGESSTVVLQFGGASGGGYISEERYQQAVTELKKHGTFEDGIYHRPKEDGGRKNQDAYEAVWEHVHGKRMEYPQSDLKGPVFLDPKEFPWEPEPESPGVQRKTLGRFSSRGFRMCILGAKAGSKLALAPHSIVFVFEGEGTSADGTPWRKHATLRTGTDAESVTVTAPCELLEMHIPPLGAS